MQMFISQVIAENSRFDRCIQRLSFDSVQEPGMHCPAKFMGRIYSPDGLIAIKILTDNYNE